MEIKCLELRDSMTFIPVICIRLVPENEAQRYLLRRDGYRGDDAGERCIIMIDQQCRSVSYDPYDWPRDRPDDWSRFSGNCLERGGDQWPPPRPPPSFMEDTL
jgi:hypothetical protein